MVGPVDNFRISLDIVGDDVDPDQVSSMLGAPPTTAHRKGDAIHGRDGKLRRHASSGQWSIEAIMDGADDFNVTLSKILETLTDDLDIWRQLSERFDTSFFCGVFLSDSNRGFTISAELMSALGERGLDVGLDIYGPE